MNNDFRDARTINVINKVDNETLIDKCVYMSNIVDGASRLCVETVELDIYRLMKEYDITIEDMNDFQCDMLDALYRYLHISRYTHIQEQVPCNYVPDLNANFISRITPSAMEEKHSNTREQYLYITMLYDRQGFPDDVVSILPILVQLFLHSEFFQSDTIDTASTKCQDYIAIYNMDDNIEDDAINYVPVINWSFEQMHGTDDKSHDGELQYVYYKYHLAMQLLNIYYSEIVDTPIYFSGNYVLDGEEIDRLRSAVTESINNNDDMSEKEFADIQDNSHITWN